MSLDAAVVAAQQALDAHVRHVVGVHFGVHGTPFWRRFAAERQIDVVGSVRGFADLLATFPNFDKAWLRDAPHEDWVPAARVGQPFHVFETGGTTGAPTQRASWQDHAIDYAAFASTLPDDAFPRGGSWLILGPTGPRRLRLAMEHLAHCRGSVAYHVDLDPRWVRRLLAEGDAATAKRYQDHVLSQAVTLLQHRPIAAVFTTPRLLELLGDRIDLPAVGVRGVLCGGTSMRPQTVRFLAEEVLDGRVAFVPVYGNTLMGLARSEPVGAHNGWEVVYHAPQPRAVLRVVDGAGVPVAFGARGQVELTTMTEELFLPRLLERDEAIRRPPVTGMPWDGVGDVVPMGTTSGKTTIEGVY